jgi:signal transduction histidine kinase
MALATLAIALVSGLIAILLGTRFVGRPLKQVRDKARRLGAGDFAGRLDLRQHDEIGELAEEMNVLGDRLADATRRLAEEHEAKIDALEQLRHTDRLATVGQLASGIAHELGTPLSVVSARAAMMASDAAAEGESKANARVIVEQAGRMTDIIRQLLDFARRRGAQMTVTDLRRIVERTLDLLSTVARTRHVTLALEAPAEPMLARIDQGQIQQALTNVILNGIQAMPRGGRLTISVGVQRARPPAERGGVESEYLCVTVADEGDGIPAESLPRIFEPFYTTKDVGEGTGLGLSVAYGIVTEHGGWIEVESTPGAGSRFRILLPPATVSSTQLHEVAS